MPAVQLQAVRNVMPLVKSVQDLRTRIVGAVRQTTNLHLTRDVSLPVKMEHLSLFQEYVLIASLPVKPVTGLVLELVSRASLEDCISNP